MKKLFMNKDKLMKVIGISTTILGFGITLADNWINEKKMDDKISEKVKKALLEDLK